MKDTVKVKIVGTNDPRRQKADVAFGIWKDRSENVATLLRKLRTMRTKS